MLFIAPKLRSGLGGRKISQGDRCHMGASSPSGFFASCNSLYMRCGALWVASATPLCFVASKRGRAAHTPGRLHLPLASTSLLLAGWLVNGSSPARHGRRLPPDNALSVHWASC
eukprot:2453673-Pyramimonas_sp.AAC.1